MGDIIRSPLVRVQPASSGGRVEPEPASGIETPDWRGRLQQERLALRAEAEAARKALLERTEAECRELRAKTEAECRRAGDAAGREGYQAGLAKGESEAGERLKATVGRLEMLIADAAEQRRLALAELERTLEPLLFAALAKIIGEFAPSAELVGSAVRRALDEVVGRAPVAIRLHPDDAALLDGAALGREATVVADALVRGGGCVIESAGGDVDAQFATQMERLSRVLRERRAR